jgi:cytochrome c oxidase subunit 3
LGSIAYFEEGSVGPKLISAGAGVLILVIIAWLSAVVRESRAGLYDTQMHRTFRWGMAWFIFSDFMLFIGLLGALWYYRLFTFPQLSGSPHAFELLTHYLLWPDFKGGWPLLANPDPAQFSGPAQGLLLGGKNIVSTLVIFASGLTLVLANKGFKTHRNSLLNTGLIATFILIAFFLLLKIEAMTLAISHLGITLSSGIYGSVVILSLSIFLLHVITAFLLLGVLIFRCLMHHFSPQNDFSIRAFSWFWYYMLVVWLILFFSVY